MSQANHPFLEFVEGIRDGVARAKDITVSGKTEPVVSESRVLLFSPHPDDECITGLLPLRLMRETDRQIINVPVTFGSKVERRAERAKELQAACDYLGWTVHREDDRLDTVTADEIVGMLNRFEPEIIFMPHAADWNSRHLETHDLVTAALEKMPADFSCQVVETEFWGAMDDPNLMVEGDAETVADLVAATALHTEEVARNPYHLLLPAWMQDNVRRGGERVGGQGSAAPDFSFATLYRLRRWQDGKCAKMLDNGKSLPAGPGILGELF